MNIFVHFPVSYFFFFSFCSFFIFHFSFFIFHFSFFIFFFFFFFFLRIWKQLSTKVTIYRCLGFLPIDIRAFLLPCVRLPFLSLSFRIDCICFFCFCFYIF